MSAKTALAIAPQHPHPPVTGTPRDIEFSIRQAESQLLGALIQMGGDDHAERVGIALGALPFLDQGQAISEGLNEDDALRSLKGRLASTRARVYDTARRIMEDGGKFNPASPPESWQECAAQALRWRRRVTEILPQLPAGWLDLGIALQAESPDAAEDAFQKAIDLDPSGPVGSAASHYLDGSIASGKMDSIPGLPRPTPPKDEATPVPTAPPLAKVDDPRTERRLRKLIGSIDLLAASESTTRSQLEKLRLAATSAPDSPEVARAIAESWARYGTELLSRKEFIKAGDAYLEARAICPTLDGIEELVVAADKERARLADRKVRLIALVLCTAIAVFVVGWEITHYVPKELPTRPAEPTHPVLHAPAATP